MMFCVVVKVCAVLCAGLAFSSCDKKALPQNKEESVVPAAPVEAIPVAKKKDAAKADEKVRVDVDLTKLSSTMVYAEVFNMLIDAESYEGKTVRMRGLFYVYEHEGSNVYACVIQDATACCAQGLAFTLSGNHRYPEDFPEVYATVTVRGRFHQYEKDGLTYTALVDGVLE